jgi:hypothetical protein
VLQQYGASYGAPASGPFGAQPFRMQVSPLALSMMDMHAHMDRWAQGQAAERQAGPGHASPGAARRSWQPAVDAAAADGPRPRPHPRRPAAPPQA